MTTAADLPDDLHIDVSLVTYNSSRWLPNFFDSLLKQNLDPARIHVHCLDNQSSDSSHADLLAFQRELGPAFAGFEVHRGPNIGFGRGHNANFRHCQCEWVLVTNVDLTFEADTLVTLLAQARRSPQRVAAWECRQKPYEHPKDYHPVTLETIWCSAACLLLRRSAVAEVGGFEPMLFMYGEDVELSYRLRDRGWLLQYVPQAVVWHHTYQQAEEVKPLQFFGSTLANILLRCRYGTRAQIVHGWLMYLGLFTAPSRIPKQRQRLLSQLLRLLLLAPRFLLSRKRSRLGFDFRKWDYAIEREGAFHINAPLPALADAPLVSVMVRTMPGFSSRLREAVASVAGQTYARIELVLVEDGGETAREFAAQMADSGRFASVKYIPLAKSGRCLAGNAALAAAQGDLLCFLDDDDLLYADHLEVLVCAFLKRPQLGAVYSLAYEVSTEIVSQEPWVYRDVLHILRHRQPFNRALLWHHNYLPIQSVLFRRSLYQTHGGFDPDLDNLEDWNLWVRYSLKNDFEMVPKVTSMYRIPANPEQATLRQDKLDQHYAQAQAKHAQIKLELSPPEVLALAQSLAGRL